MHIYLGLFSDRNLEHTNLQWSARTSLLNRWYGIWKWCLIVVDVMLEHLIFMPCILDPIVNHMWHLIYPNLILVCRCE